MIKFEKKIPVSGECDGFIHLDGLSDEEFFVLVDEIMMTLDFMGVV